MAFPELQTGFARLNDRKVELELQVIRDYLRENLNGAAIARETATAFKDGQLEALNRVLRGDANGSRLILIGTTDPGYCLYAVKTTVLGSDFPGCYFSSIANDVEVTHIVHAGDGPGLRVTRTSGSGGSAKSTLWLEHQGSSNIIEAYGGGVLKWRVDSNGLQSQVSARALKEGFCEIPDERILDIVRSLPIVEYSFPGDTRRHVGPVAEEFQAVTGLGDGTSIAYSDLAALAFRAVQLLERKIECLEERIRSLGQAGDEKAN